MEADKDNPALEGYDPDELYDVFERVNGDPDFKHALAEEWEAMSEEERAKYVRRTRDHSGNMKEHPGDWSTFVRNRTVQEMNVLLGRTGISSHCRDMMEARGVFASEISEARLHPLHKTPTVYDDLGRPSFQLIGPNATIAVNPETNVAISVWKTGKKEREVFGRSGNGGTE